jgi:hypothetical protein
MTRHTSLGIGYLNSDMNRSLSTTGASNIITRLASPSLTGHALSPQVHQHYGLEFHIVLKGNSCIRRGCWGGATARKVCTQLERSALEGLHTCVFNETRVLSLSDKDEQCFRARPLLDLQCDFTLCFQEEEDFIQSIVRWMRKNRQWALHDQRDIC